MASTSADMASMIPLAEGCKAARDTRTCGWATQQHSAPVSALAFRAAHLGLQKTPKGGVGTDELVISLATLLADIVSNPYSDGYSKAHRQCQTRHI
ncbi:hypothetical protein ZIOFF_005214 [Zingiber officinale]|uniref:Uncharacterized protein n=1 Tax=Zingiber officinale TaxID=94328 RepID=A0A8J5HM44_ZINOF|nr:hypothetical protein ZIOFF_005214 [Zingiber officinale]